MFELWDFCFFLNIWYSFWPTSLHVGRSSWVCIKNVSHGEKRVQVCDEKSRNSLAPPHLNPPPISWLKDLYIWDKLFKMFLFKLHRTMIFNNLFHILRLVHNGHGSGVLRKITLYLLPTCSHLSHISLCINRVCSAVVYLEIFLSVWISKLPRKINIPCFCYQEVCAFL